MSLLMQALKKAEQTKQQQVVDTQLSLSPNEHQVEDLAVTDSALKVPAPQDVSPVDMLTSGLTLSPHDDDVKHVSLHEPSIDTVLNMDVNVRASENMSDASIPNVTKTDFVKKESGGGVGAPTVSASPKGEDEKVVDASPVPILPSENVNGTSQRTRMDVEQLQAKAQAEKEILHEQKKAKSVFAAKALGGAQKKRMALFALLTLTVMLVGGAYIYLLNMNSASSLLPSNVQNQSTQSVASDTPATVVTSAASTAQDRENESIVPASDAAVTMASKVTSNDNRIVEKTSIAHENTVETHNVSQVPSVSSSMSASPVLPAKLPEKDVMKREAEGDQSLSRSKAKTAATLPNHEASTIKIYKGSTESQINPALQTAYQLFLSGNANLAEQQYLKVLNDEPRNRDALLGMAVIALSRQHTDQAGMYYGKLLDLDPADPDAIAGLTSLQQGDPIQSESRLKKVLHRDPNASTVLFALGNLYAQQSRWSDAQQFFFRAYTNAPNNPDYTFNLAVSLDRLSQAKLAKEYYQRALILPQTSPGNFNKVDVQKRIRILNEAIGSND